MTSMTAENWVLRLGREQPDLHHTELHVLVVLAARHNRDYGAAFPKVELMHRETHLSVRQIQRVLNTLEQREILAISYGPLPVTGSNGRPVYGNVYRFVGFDEIPEDARPRRRAVIPLRQPHDAVSREPSDVVSCQPRDTGDTVDVTSEGGARDTGDATHVTSANSPLYPVVNPGLTTFDVKNPDLNPVRAEARLTGNERPNAICSKCGEELLISRGIVRLDKALLCVPCGRGAPPRASPSLRGYLRSDSPNTDSLVPAGGEERTSG